MIRITRDATAPSIGGRRLLEFRSPLNARSQDPDCRGFACPTKYANADTAPGILQGTGPEEAALR